MKLLLDTNAALWFALDHPSLSQPAKLAIESSANEVLISPASHWEIAIKISLGKYKLHAAFEIFWQELISGSRFVVLPLDIQHTGCLSRLPFYHKDPFDRLLVSQAMVEGATIISPDTQLDAYGVGRLW